MFMARNVPKSRKPPLRPTAVTLVLDGAVSAPGELGSPTVEQVRRRFIDRLANAKVQLACGVLEVALVEHEHDRYPTAWAWHLHGLVFTRNADDLAKRLSKVFPSSDTVPRPVFLVPWDGNLRWLRYSHKLDTQCRIGVDDSTHFDVKTQETRRSRGTKKRALTASERLELLTFHDKISLDSRIITRRAQLRSTKDGCAIVRLRRPRR